ncbi:MAG: alpha/beta hydrolase [Candidatus Hydrogenedentes bacterium]|nr:alpha/beta hydrolase [Candidatus Hydrogenedentota bacterium]
MVLTVVAIFGFYVIFSFVQRNLIFVTNHTFSHSPQEYDWKYEEVWLDVAGEKTHGWFIPVDNARGVALFSHGNDSNISSNLGTVRWLRGLGFSTLLYDYGGYGESTGRPSEKRVYADGLAMWDYLVHQRHVPPEKILLYGVSFGGGATCDLASRVHCGAVILDSTFLSIPDAAFERYPWFPGRWFIHHDFDNKSKMGKISAPLLVLHSRDDSLYPIRHGQELFALAPEPKYFQETQGDHGTSFEISKKLYEQSWSQFLAPLF